MKAFAPLFLLIALVLGGCSSYVANVQPGKHLRVYQRVFVKANFDDNRGTDARIARALQERGFQVEHGHLTMMPPTTQAIVTFEDRWAWDFKTHLTYFRLDVQDAKTEQRVANAVFSGPTALSAGLDEVIDRLVTQLADPSPKKKK